MIRVVVVEDSLLLRKGIVFTTNWESCGCEVVGEAGDGISGVRIIEQLQPDIVVTDIRMPDLDGLAMIEQLKGKTKALFIILTAYNEFEYARKAIHLGVVDYVSKPLNDDEFSTVLKKTCEKVVAQKEYEKLERHMSNMDDSRIMLFKEYLAGGTSCTEAQVSCAVRFIEEHYAQDIGVLDVANATLLSESHISRIFKEVTGYTIVEYLQNFRIKKACCLLSEPSMRIYEVSDQVGYRDQRYFSVMFKKMVGVSPREFKNKCNVV
jgi:two-component system response regulator YesN